MTVSTTHRLVNLTGNGTTDTFTFDFKTLDAADIQAYEDGVEDTNITVVLNADQTANPGGTCKFDTAPPANLALVDILRNMTLDQQIDYPLGGNFPSESHEGGLDKLTMLIQEAEELALNGIHYPEFERGFTSKLPAAVDRAGKFLAFDGDGDAMVRVSSTTDPNAVQKAPTHTDGNIIEFDAGGDAEDSGIPSSQITDNATRIGGLTTLPPIDIGDWDMDTVAIVNVAHGIDYSKIRNVSVWIRDDADSSIRDFAAAMSGNETSAIDIQANASFITLTRATNGAFDNAAYNLTPFNRGWMIIQHIDL